MKPARLVAALLLVAAAAACVASPTLPSADAGAPAHERGPTFGGGD